MVVSFYFSLLNANMFTEHSFTAKRRRNDIAEFATNELRTQIHRAESFLRNS